MEFAPTTTTTPSTRTTATTRTRTRPRTISKTAKRSFGHKKNKGVLARLGEGTESVTGLGKKLLLITIILVPFFVWVNFHPIYLKTGTPMFKYGLSMAVLQPFHSIWAIFKILQAYVF